MAAGMDSLPLVPRLSARLRAVPRDLGARLGRMTVWQWALVGMVGAYVWSLTAKSLQLHYALVTSAYDYALYDQGVWLLSRFESPFVTLMGRHLFGDHASFVLLLLVPFYWVVPGAGTLLFSQSLAIGAGAIPIFLYARHRLGSEAMALVLAGVYLLHPALGWTNLEQFHPDAFYGTFVAFAIYGALMRKWRLHTVFVVLTLLVKEDSVLIVLPLAIWVALRRDALIGVLTAVWSVGYGLFATIMFMQFLSGHPTLNLWRIPFGGPTGLLRTALSDPGAVIDHLRSDGRPWYVWQMTAPFAWVFARLPEIAAIGGLVLVGNIVSTFWYQYQIQYHYSLVLVVPLAMGTVHAIGAFQRRRRLVVGGVALAALWTSFLWGTVLPNARDGRDIPDPSRPSAVAGREILALVPSDAIISVDHALAPHVARRHHVYMFPNPFSTVLYGTPGRPPEGVRLPIADEVEYVAILRHRSGEYAAAWDAVSHEFWPTMVNQFWELHQRRDP